MPTMPGTAVSTVVAAVKASIDRFAGNTGTIGVACSGGIDSIALADAVIEAAGAARVVVATIDHDLVPTSGEVAAGVAAWAAQRGARTVVRVVEVEDHASLEAAARAARYAALEAVMDDFALTVMLLGHTARDQAETVLMRIVRGTGPAGLAGMPAVRGRVRDSAVRDSAVRDSAVRDSAIGGVFVRPLLALPRALTEAYVRARGLPTWDDPMNRDPAITRVRIRDTLLPLVRVENPAIDDALVRLADATREWLDVIDTLAAPFGRFPIDCPALAAQAPAVRKRALALALDRARMSETRPSETRPSETRPSETRPSETRPSETRPSETRPSETRPSETRPSETRPSDVSISYDATHLERLDELVTAPSRGEIGIDLPGIRVTRSYDTLRIEVVSDADPDFDPQPARFTVPPRYVMRVWAPGDRMCPARLKGHSKKLSDLYIDAKVPRDMRRIAQVMVRVSDAVIVWAEHIGIAFGESLDLAPVPV